MIEKLLRARRVAARVPDLARRDAGEDGGEGGGEDTEPLLRRTSFGGEDVLRMSARMAGALSRMGCVAGDMLALSGQHGLHGFALLMAALAGGLKVRMLAEGDETLPPDVKRLICHPAQKARFEPLAKARGIRLATLGGQLQGSFFMLQMVRTETALKPAEEPLAVAFADGTEKSLRALREDAAALGKRLALEAHDHLLLCAPVMASAHGLAHALACWPGDMPLTWVHPADRDRLFSDTEPPVAERPAIIGDEAFFDSLGAARGPWRALRDQARCMTI